MITTSTSSTHHQYEDVNAEFAMASMEYLDEEMAGRTAASPAAMNVWLLGILKANSIGAGRDG